MLQPKRTKYRKTMRGKMKGKPVVGTSVVHGEFGLQTMEPAWINSKQIEAARKAVVRETKRKGKLWLKIFPHKSYSKKPAEVRMGKGKGDVEGYVAVVRPGRIMMEIAGVTEDIARLALRKAGQKLPVQTQIISREL
jgi:large subunit ribosomal protein L16